MFKFLKQLFCKHHYKHEREIILRNEHLDDEQMFSHIFDFEVYIDVEKCVKCGKERWTEKTRLI